MSFFRSITVVLVLAGFTSVMASPSVTFTGKTEAKLFKWKQGPIKLYLSSSLFRASASIKRDSDVTGALRRAAEAWTGAADVEFQFEQSEKGGVSPAGPAGDSVSLITLAPSAENVLFFAKDGQTAAAKTRVFYNRRGTISEADIVLNPFLPFSTDGSYGTFDLQSVLTHEIGHLLGLRHSEVVGSIMFDNLAKNGSGVSSEFQPRTLSETDIAAVREIYGVADDDEDCCSSVSGKLTLATGNAAKDLKVWAEESSTGRVIGQSESGRDGIYRIGGLAGGIYKIYWKTKGGWGEVGTVDLEKDGSSSLDGRISPEASKLSAEFMGQKGELSEGAIQIDKDTESLITIAGKNLANVSKISFSSPFLHVEDVLDDSVDLGDGVNSVGFYVRTDANAPAGVYTIFLTSPSGEKTSLIGAIRIR